MPWPWCGIVYAAEWAKAANEALQVAQTSGTERERLEASWEVSRAETEWSLADAVISFQWFSGLRRAMKNNPSAVQVMLADLPAITMLQTEFTHIADAIVELEDRDAAREAEAAKLRERVARLEERDAAREQQIRTMADAIVTLEDRVAALDQQEAVCG